MNCPACTRTLTKKMADCVEADVCDGGCGGIWFDNHELPKLDNACESAGEDLLDVAPDPSITVDHHAARSCPKCDNQPMMRRFASPRREVELDECPACGGIWLDAGELGRIRDQFQSEEDRDTAYRSYFDEVFGADMLRMQQEDEAATSKARRFARMFRFLSPSNYVRREKAWEAL